MSKLKQVIMIQPPLFLMDSRVEREVSGGHKCPICNGSGKILDNTIIEERIYEKCPFCEGSGKIKAVITTEWHPE